MALSNNAAPRSISILGNMAKAPEATKTDAKPAREPSLFWANIGITLPGAGEDGADLFVSIPVGLALDDMKPTVIRGNKPHTIALMQAKNDLLEQLKSAAGRLEPGEGAIVDELRVQLYRKGEPQQVGDEESNPLIAQMRQRLTG